MRVKWKGRRNKVISIPEIFDDYIKFVTKQRNVIVYTGQIVRVTDEAGMEKTYYLGDKERMQIIGEKLRNQYAVESL